MQYFFSTNILDNLIILSKEESTHCMKVLRHEIGDSIFIVDGKGSLFTCKIISMNNGCVNTEIINKEKLSKKTDQYIHICIAPTKSSQRIEWFIEKSIEIGVDEISFVKCLNSERKKININRIHKIALSAMKQSLKSYLPKINDVIDFEDVIMGIKQESKYIGYLDKTNHFLNHIAPTNSSYCLIIGPEGDFTSSELEFSAKHGFTPVLLGNSRLRTETAGLVGCLVLNQINYDK
tara:strand:+ start:109 stop:813 length:705 start_codon:yes stop_codon:yes gene_type:complete